ncbi:hypothetical protein STEG23_036986 [Scotinomys teguina]
MSEMQKRKSEKKEYVLVSISSAKLTNKEEWCSCLCFTGYVLDTFNAVIKLEYISTSMSKVDVKNLAQSIFYIIQSFSCAAAVLEHSGLAALVRNHILKVNLGLITKNKMVRTFSFKYCTSLDDIGIPLGFGSVITQFSSVTVQSNKRECGGSHSEVYIEGNQYAGTVKHECGGSHSEVYIEGNQYAGTVKHECGGSHSEVYIEGYYLLVKFST